MNNEGLQESRINIKCEIYLTGGPWSTNGINDGWPTIPPQGKCGSRRKYSWNAYTRRPTGKPFHSAQNIKKDSRGTVDEVAAAACTPWLLTNSIVSASPSLHGESSHLHVKCLKLLIGDIEGQMSPLSSSSFGWWLVAQLKTRII